MYLIENINLREGFALDGGNPRLVKAFQEVMKAPFYHGWIDRWVEFRYGLSRWLFLHINLGTISNSIGNGILAG